MTEPSAPPFGRLLTAMVTPFTADGALDLSTAVALAEHLVDELGHDGLVLNGTTGESPTTTDAEKRDLVAAVVAAVGDRARILAGVGTFSTEHTIRLAREAEQAGAHGLLVVTPYYSKPPQSGLVAHFAAVADATALPVMLYDIPKRSGTPIASASLLELAGHDRIVAVKDAKGDLVASAQVIAQTAALGHPLAYYSGDDPMTLPLLAVGGVGVVGTSTHFTAAAMRALLEAHLRGDVAEALRVHQATLPLFTGIFATQGCMLVKAGLALQGRPVGGLRAPLLDASPDEVAALRTAMTAVGVLAG